MCRQLVEYAQGGKLRVDKGTATLYGVRLLGERSANGRRYSERAMQEAAQMYVGKAVNDGHPAQPNAPRKNAERLGTVTKAWYDRNSRAVFGNVRLLRTHPLTPRILEAAADPGLWSCYGFSHNAQGEGANDSRGIFVVERLTDVLAVDLVQGAATNSSLAEGRRIA